MKEKSVKIKKWLYPFIILSCFFISFLASCYVFINSSDLVFSTNEKELKNLTAQLGKKDEEITNLKFQLERYKTLYEKELLKTSPAEIEEENN